MTAGARSAGANRTANEESLAVLVRQLSDQGTRLAQLEVELAKAELQQKGRQIGIGAGAFGGAGVFGLYAFGALTATLILALATLVDGWLAAAIVTAAYAAIAGSLALVGRSRVEAGTPPAPERAIESAKLDVDAAKRSAREARA
jgi:hypothetical protein